LSSALRWAIPRAFVASSGCPASSRPTSALASETEQFRHLQFEVVLGQNALPCLEHFLEERVGSREVAEDVLHRGQDLLGADQLGMVHGQEPRLGHQDGPLELTRPGDVAALCPVRRDALLRGEEVGMIRGQQGCTGRKHLFEQLARAG
jgi:hypothetical protein